MSDTGEKPRPLKPTPALEEGDFHSIGWALFARDLEGDDDQGALGVLHWFTQAVQAGYVPPDAMLRWLAARFALYLETEGEKTSIGAALGLTPTGPGKKDVRTRRAETQRTEGYIHRLALLDLAMGEDASLDYLDRGVPGILAPYAPKAGVLKGAEEKASAWRKSPLYRQLKEVFSDMAAGGKFTALSQLREYVKKANRD